MLDKLIDWRAEARPDGQKGGVGGIDRLTDWQSQELLLPLPKKAIEAWIEIEIEAESNVYLSQAAHCVPMEEMR